MVVQSRFPRLVSVKRPEGSRRGNFAEDRSMMSGKRRDGADRFHEEKKQGGTADKIRPLHNDCAEGFFVGNFLKFPEIPDRKVPIYLCGHPDQGGKHE